MGNSFGGGRKTAKVMKINGDTFKLKTPAQAGSVLEDFPGYCLLESEAVKHFGIRAKALEPQQELKPKKLYFLVELPKFPQEKAPRRARSGINMSAKDRLESLMLSRRSVSDLSTMRAATAGSNGGSESGPMQVTMRLPKAEVDKLMKESKDETEVARKLMNHIMASSGGSGGDEVGLKDGKLKQQMKWKSGQEMVGKKRVCFMPITEGEIQVAVAS